MKLIASVAMIGGTFSKRIRPALPTPISNPMRPAPMRPGSTAAFSPPISFIAAMPPMVMTAGIDRSMLPAPLAITNIWPAPANTENTAKLSEAVSIAPAPRPADAAIATNQVTRAARKDHNHGWGAARAGRLVEPPPPPFPSHAGAAPATREPG